MQESQSELTIISIVAKRRTDSCYLNFDNGESLLVNIDIITRFFLSKGKKLNAELLDTITAEQRLIEVRKAAYRFATYKPRSVLQMRMKLKEKGFLPDEVDFAIKYLLSFSLIDDAFYAENFIKNKAKSKNFGINRVIAELRGAGVSQSIIEDSISRYFPCEDTYQMAMSAATKKYKLIRNKPIDKQRTAMMSYLQRQGFSWDIIKNVANELIK